MEQKIIIVTRGASGCGKTTFANILTREIGWVSVSADSYFEDGEGNYNFIAEDIGKAHAHCRARFMEALKEHTVKGIVVANTNTKPSDFDFYVKEGEKVGAKIIVTVLENRHGGNNIHNVPEHVLERQENQIRSTLKLR